jgi:ribonucleotide monophosphatase NagD (HAD superfamily)
VPRELLPAPATPRSLMTERKAVESWLTDMDGVLVHEGEPVPGAPEFVNRMKQSGKPFLILTNNSIYTPRDLQARLARMGFDVPEQSIWTAALATAQFLADQRPGGTAYVIGDAGLRGARRDPHVQLRGDHQGGPPDQRRRPVHLHQPRPDRALQ